MHGLRFWSAAGRDHVPGQGEQAGTQDRSLNPRWLRRLAAATEYNLLLAGAVAADRSSLWARLWGRWWGQSQRRHGGVVVPTRLHQRTVSINFGHLYPIFSRRFPTYNEPLVELVLAAAREGESPVRVLDVGAGVGDTAFLLSQRCGTLVSDWILVEGHPRFAALLEANVRRNCLPAVVMGVLVSDVTGPVPAPAATPAGSASLQGTEMVQATTLDALVAEGRFGRIDVMKLDLDGWDGRTLAGAVGLLEEWQPAVLFEWSPRLLRETGNPSLQAFEVLGSCGYDRFVWFDKFGRFSHFQVGAGKESVELLERFCLETQTLEDWHYDVAALPRRSGISPLTLADMAEAVRSRSGRDGGQ
jgi:FkbM family methyltransferase